MKTKTKNRVVTITLFAFFLIFSLWCFCKPADKTSVSERRDLAQMPTLRTETLLSGKFAEDFGEYTLDQFPLRDEFRALKAFVSYNVFGQKDNNGIYVADGYVSKLEYPVNEAMLTYAGERFSYVCETYFKDTGANLYFSIVPDKNYFLAEENGYLSMDYGALVSSMREKTADMQYIDIFDTLELSDYYHTDTHWKQECLSDTATRLAEEMGVNIEADYQTVTLDHPFYGVYYGQAALKMEPDTLQYLTNDTLASCIVHSYNTGSAQPAAMYDMEKAVSKDPYEIYLGGADALITIENPDADTGHSLILFRDSFGSSITPLLVEGYEKIILVDIRYINSALLGNFLPLEEIGETTDVLFLYSTLVLNASRMLK